MKVEINFIFLRSEQKVKACFSFLHKNPQASKINLQRMREKTPILSPGDGVTIRINWLDINILEH